MLTKVVKCKNKRTPLPLNLNTGSSQYGLEGPRRDSQGRKRSNDLRDLSPSERPNNIL